MPGDLLESTDYRVATTILIIGNSKESLFCILRHWSGIRFVFRRWIISDANYLENIFQALYSPCSYQTVVNNV